MTVRGSRAWQVAFYFAFRASFERWLRLPAALGVGLTALRCARTHLMETWRGREVCLGRGGGVGRRGRVGRRSREKRAKRDA
eukprot:1093254-Pleurochrysis_carterae.AAC.1